MSSGDRDVGRPLLHKVACDLGAAVADADDERPPAREPRPRVVVGGMEEAAAEVLHSRPAREHTLVVVTGGNDDDARSPRPAVRLERPERRPVERPNLPDRLAQTDVEAKARGVVLQVLGEEILGDVPRVCARDSVVGQTGEAAHRVEAEALISPRPGPADALVLVEDDRLVAPCLQRGGGRETCRTGADDRDGGRVLSVALSTRHGSSHRRRRSSPAPSERRSGSCPRTSAARAGESCERRSGRPSQRRTRS
jgi:hypothetical protein